MRAEEEEIKRLATEEDLRRARLRVLTLTKQLSDEQRYRAKVTKEIEDLRARLVCVCVCIWVYLCMCV